ncbi:N-acyl homoserine lactonase family protein [Pseudomonas putida]|uniref:N-acyl homoserine lactonase family protein n=1 Tax=Pseudomonas putida TaxID=303 RepID=UPI000D3D9DB2|nr:N-acyl homoserine lactonase family protein [Pseudomonas putida]PTV56812.1 MBL fold hydrolase [Pseudomonas putida]
MSALPCHEVFAIRYATVARKRHENFISSTDPHDGPMPMDYFVWLIRGNGKCVLVDTGFNQVAADKRQRQLLRCPIGALEPLGVSAEHLQDVIITHMHYDHAGNINLLPNARFHVQSAEINFATGRYMLYPPLRHSFNVEDVVNIVRGVYQQRVVFHDGNSEFSSGIELVKVGGHTAGLQVVRVHTARGWIVLASDASHYYANLQQDSPFPIVLNVGEMLDGYRTLLSLVPSPDHVIPGHDPLVRQRYPIYGGEDADIVALHMPPLVN